MFVSWESKEADALTSISTCLALSKAEVEKLVALLLFAAIDRKYL